MPRSDNTTAALLMMSSMAAFTLNDAVMKSMAGDVPLYQLLFLRGVMTTAAIAVITWRMGLFKVRVSRRDWGFIWLRSLAEIAAAYFFLTALFNMPFANVTAILQALPLTITLAAALFLGEPVGWRRILAIAAGFTGVLLIVRPGASDFNLYSLYALGAVGCVTLRDLATRKLSPEAPSVLVMFIGSVVVMVVFGLVSLAIPWTPMTPRTMGLTSLAALLIIGAYLFSILVMRKGEIAFVAPFRYTGLLWALLLGWVVFGEWPDAVTLLGAGIVVGSGLFMLYREARLGRAAR